MNDVFPLSAFGRREWNALHSLTKPKPLTPNARAALFVFDTASDQHAVHHVHEPGGRRVATRRTMTATP